MNKLKVFENKEFGTVRALEIDNKPWFVGKDIAEIMGYQNGSRDINRHVDEDDTLKHGLVDSMGRTQETILINESGLYSLILSSKLPKAKQFKRWVTSEVLPAIREHGAYVPKGELRTYLYKGQKVVTLPDFIRHNGNSKKEQQALQSWYRYHRRKNRFLTEQNCIVLGGRALLGFQIENDIWLYNVAHLTLLTADAVEFLNYALQHRLGKGATQRNAIPEKTITSAQNTIAEIETMKQEYWGEKMERKVLTLRLVPEIIGEIKKDAERTGITMAALVTQLIIQKYGSGQQQ